MTEKFDVEWSILEIAGLEPAPSLNATEVYLPIIPYPLAILYIIQCLTRM
jgi:hypothetical protein